MNTAAATSRRNFCIGVVAVTATYVYFLLFAEFAFLQLVAQARQPLRPTMLALGLGGIAGSILAAWRFRADYFVPRLSLSLLACGAIGAVALLVAGPLPFLATAFLVGAALGSATVTLSGGLRFLLGDARLGIAVGLATGVAYALGNVPALFAGGARVQTLASAGAVLLAGIAVRFAQPAGELLPPPPRASGPWTLIFLALVWMDSAAFYVIQHTPALQQPTWSGDRHLWANAAIHLAVAAGSGWMLDRGLLRTVAVSAWVALAAAAWLLRHVPPSANASLLYAGGVSLYSAALVYFPASTGRPWVAALVFAISGWVGSALGIGMAEDLHGIPLWLVPASGAVLAVVLLAGRHGAAPLALVAAALGLAPRTTQASASALEREGREVYLAEGCINCHSQYVRPRVALDVERWGPPAPLAELVREKPPLPGNRRQGPDLLNVGLRRSADWNRLHFQDPTALAPGSRMPSYAHLFAAGDPRGHALLAYLASLGLDRSEARAAFIAGWQPRPKSTVRPSVAAQLFHRLCSVCHGADGAGNGLLAGQLRTPPPNWIAGDPWRYSGGDELRLARIIKFGILGSPMAGHESLDDDAVVALARHVQTLKK